MTYDNMKSTMFAIARETGKKVRWGYKVCQVMGDGVLCSAMSGASIYGIGYITKPNRGCGPLCVYNTSTRAASTFIMGGVFRMYRCIYIPSAEHEVWMYDSKRDLCNLPIGTKLAEMVMLTRWMG